MSRWFFTFGVGYNLGRNYVTVEADTADEARRIFIAARAQVDDEQGRCWAFQYGEDEYDEAIAGWDLTEVDIYAPIWWRA